MKTKLVIVVAIIQAVLVGLAVWPQLSARATGTEYLMRVGPVDPIEPFRGAYVQLGYPDLRRGGNDGVGIGTVESDRDPGTVFIPLEKSGKFMVGGPYSRTRPTSGPYLSCDTRGWSVRCGIESWFLPQGKASELGQQISKDQAVAVVKIDRWGHAALTDVRVERP